jgi:hypothetical protein
VQTGRSPLHFVFRCLHGSQAWFTRCLPLDLAEFDVVSAGFFNLGIAILAALVRWPSLEAVRGDCGTRKIWGVWDGKEVLGERCALDVDESGVLCRIGVEAEDSMD